MSFSFDNQSLEITCPTCKGKINRTVSWFKKSGQSCPNGCGTIFNTQDFAAKINDAERQLRQFQKDLGKITIKF